MAEDSESNVKILEQYFNNLDAASFEAAANQFTEDVLYRHPPMYGDETEIRGRDSLLSFFREVRGPQDSHHHIERMVEGDNALSAVGYVTGAEDDEPVEYFVAYAEFADGLIDYYIAGLLGMK